MLFDIFFSSQSEPWTAQPIQKQVATCPTAPYSCGRLAIVQPPSGVASPRKYHGGRLYLLRFQRPARRASIIEFNRCA